MGRKKLRVKKGRLAASIVIFLCLILVAGYGFTSCSKAEPDGSESRPAGQAGNGEEDPDFGENQGESSGEGLSDEGGDKSSDGLVQDPQLLILVNKTNEIDPSYEPDDLVLLEYYAPDRERSWQKMRQEAADQFHLLIESALEEGLVMKATTAYRSYSAQQILFNNYVGNYGEEEANTFSARPGQSEHQTGLATDVSAESVNWKLTTDFADTTEGKWLADSAHKFGFIIRFPLGKEDITGYQFEPWHIRYVGQPAATEIYQRGLTLEEYLGVI